MEKTLVKSREFTGIVVSDNMDKTVAVEVVRMKLNVKYSKRIKVSKKYLVHDEKNEAKIGDKIKFVECRPLSKNKRWRLAEVIK